MKNLSISSRKMSEYLTTPGSALVKMFGSTSTGFKQNFKSNLVLIAQVPGQNPEDMNYEVKFFSSDPNPDKLPSPDKCIQTTPVSYKEVSIVHVDEFRYISIETSKSLGTLKLNVKITIIDMNSVFNQNLDYTSAINYDTIEYILALQNPLSNPRSVTIDCITNYLIAGMHITIGNETEYLNVIDLKQISASYFNVSGLNTSRYSLLNVNDDGILIYLQPIAKQRMNVISVSSAKCYIGLYSLPQMGDFSYSATLSYRSAGSTLSYSFDLNGTVIKDMDSLVKVLPDFFSSEFSYYYDLDYNVYIYWGNIRGSDIRLQSKNSEDDLKLFSYKYLNQSIDLEGDYVIRNPESYFIRQDILVIFDKNYEDNSATILIFRFIDGNDYKLRYRAVNNHTITSSLPHKLDLSRTIMRSVEVFYDNILTLVELSFTNSISVSATLINFLGPNYLKGNLSIPVEKNGFDFSIQPLNSTTCYLLICSTDSFTTKFLNVWLVQLQYIDKSKIYKSFGINSNIFPVFMPVGLFPDLVDNTYLIVKSYLPSADKTYTMRLNVNSSTIKEYQRERLINKNGKICPTKDMFVSFDKNKIVGYTFPPGKNYYNRLEFFSSDLDFSKPYDMKCYIDKNLILIGQHKSTQTLKFYIVYIFLTDKLTEADKRLNQRIEIPEDVTTVTVTVEDSQIYLQYAISNNTNIGRTVVFLTRAVTIANLSSPATDQPSPREVISILTFTTLSGQRSDVNFTLRFEKPIYAANITSKDKVLYSANISLFGLEDYLAIEGPVYNLALQPANQSKSRLLEQRGETDMPFISDLSNETQANIRAPIFTYFEYLLQTSSLFIGLTNDAYGFNICVQDLSFMQNPLIKNVPGTTVLHSEVIEVDEDLYLFVKGRSIGDKSFSLQIFTAKKSDQLFVLTGRLC